jgi:hypothetical protein
VMKNCSAATELWWNLRPCCSNPWWYFIVSFCFPDFHRKLR